MNVRHGEQVQQVCCVCCHSWNNLLRINVYLYLLRLMGVGEERPKTSGGSSQTLGRINRVWGGRGVDRPEADRLWGGSTGTRGVVGLTRKPS